MVNSLKPVKQQQPPHHGSVDHQHPTFASLPTHHEAIYKHNDSDDISPRPVKKQKLSQTRIPSSWTRSAANHEPFDPTPRPPSKLTRTAPDSELLQTTNGVSTRIDAGDEDIQLDPNQAVQAKHTTDAKGRSQKEEPRKTQDRRSLRSHDEGSRLKSDLAIYFPNYEDIINDVPQDKEFLTPDTVIHIKHESKEIVPEPLAASPKAPASASRHKKHASISDTTIAPLSPAHKFNGCQILDFSTIERSVPHHPQDPLTDAFYFKAHRRAERKEKQLRNIEKERAMHEKAQLDRLLEGLQGHDWLRVLGVTGVTDSEARKFELKRDYFINEVSALVKKFKEWKEEEKRLKLEKEAALTAKEGGHTGEEASKDDAEIEDSEAEPSSSELDASAAAQLHREATGSAKGKAKQEIIHVQPPPPPIIYRPPTPEGPFLSFYSKPHIRAAALGKQRHGRNVLAFGHLIPDVEEHEFGLPAEYITPEALKESARRRRRMKRESIANMKEKRKG